MSARPPRTGSAGDPALVDRLARNGARYDADQQFPGDSLAALVESGDHRRFAPVNAGGERFADAGAGAGAAALLDALRLVGRGDLSVGRLFEGHINALALFGWYADETQLSWLGDRLNEGAWFGVWATEVPPGVVISDEDGGHRLGGSKSFASGAGGLDFAIVTARSDDGARQSVVVPANDVARADLSGWTVRGMKASVSGRYTLDGLRVDAGALLGKAGDYDRDPRFTAGAWRFLAVHLGGIEAALIETQGAMSDAAREDPVARARFAGAVAATRTAHLWVREAARRAAQEDSDSVPLVQLARGIVERAALDVMEAAARLCGTKSAFTGGRLDKVIRDLSLYLRQAGPDHARDQAAIAWLDGDRWGEGDRLW